MSDTPSEYAMTPGRGGVIPPIATRWKPGEAVVGAGRPPNAGRSLKEHINLLAHKQLSYEDLVKIGRSKTRPALEVIAANRLLSAMERPDMSDYEPLLDGQMSIRELKASGVDTVGLKKVKQKTRSVPDGDGGHIHEVEREIELHDRSREESMFVTEQTDGKPSQSVDVNSLNLTVDLTKVDNIQSFPFESLRKEIGCGGEPGEA